MHAFGKPLTVKDVPTPGRGEVLIKVVANGVPQHGPPCGARMGSVRRAAV